MNIQCFDDKDAFPYLIIDELYNQEELTSLMNDFEKIKFKDSEDDSKSIIEIEETKDSDGNLLYVTFTMSEDNYDKMMITKSSCQPCTKIDDYLNVVEGNEGADNFEATIEDEDEDEKIEKSKTTKKKIMHLNKASRTISKLQKDITAISK